MDKAQEIGTEKLSQNSKRRYMVHLNKELVKEEVMTIDKIGINR